MPENFLFFLRGLLIGFSIAAPVGPIGVLCIRRTLAEGRATGFASGLGAATADAFYGLVAGFGLTAVSDLLQNQRIWLNVIGGLFLCYLALKTFFSKPSKKASSFQDSGLLGAYLSTVFLTLTNPATIFSFAAVFAGLGLGKTNGNYWLASTLVLGVFLGSTAWWLILSGSVSLFRNRFDTQKLVWVNRISGIIIALFGLYALFSLF